MFVVSAIDASQACAPSASPDPGTTTALLKGLGLFSTLDAGDLHAVERIAKRVRFEAGEDLCEQGEVGMCLFIVAIGRAVVRASRDGGEAVEVAELGAGAVIGELALVDARPRSATVRALEPVDAIRIDRASFLRLQMSKSPAAYKLMQAMALQICGRLRTVNSNVSALMSGGHDPRSSASPARRAASRSRSVSTSPRPSARLISAVPPGRGPRSASGPNSAPPPTEREARRSFWRKMVTRVVGG